MPISAYLRGLREHVGPALLLVPGVAALVRDEAGRILVERRSDDGQWSLPAGVLDPGEEPARAVVREVWEETGLRVQPLRVAGVFGGAAFRHTYPNGDVVEPMVVLFECRIAGGRLEPRDGECLELRFVSPEAMPPLVMPYPPAVFQREPDAPAVFAWDPAWLRALDEPISTSDEERF